MSGNGKYLIHTVLIIAASIFILVAKAQTWEPLGSGVTISDTSDIPFVRVNAMVEYNGELFVGGYFDDADGNTVSGLAKWNDTSWWVTSALNGVFGGPDIASMIVYDGKLYATGRFDSIGGVSANCIARWDGSNWFWTGSGLGGNPYAYSMTIYHDRLYIGGRFTVFNNIPVSRIVSMNASNTNTVGGGLGGSNSASVYAMAVYDDELYVGGTFTSVGGDSVNGIAKWNDSVWSAVGTGGPWSKVYAMAAYNGELYVSGMDTGNYYLHKWNGTTWSSMGDSLDNLITSLAVISGELYAGGNFSTLPDGTSATSPAKWDGVGWSQVGSGLGRVYSMVVYDSALYAGGHFDSINGVSYNNIAKWVLCTPPTLSSGIAQPLCNGDAGSIAVTACCAIPPYIYVWNTGDTSQSISSLSAGTYTLTVTDSISCPTRDTFTVLIPEVITADFFIIPDSTNVPNCSGAVSVVVAGGIPPYSFSWSNAATTDYLNDLCAGIYILTVTDGNGCTLSTDVIVDLMNGINYVSPAIPKVYPNPTTDLLNYRSLQQPTSIKVYDVCGRESFFPSTNPIDVSSLTPGIYVVELVTNSQHYRQRFVKL